MCVSNGGSATVQTCSHKKPLCFTRAPPLPASSSTWGYLCVCVCGGCVCVCVCVCVWLCVCACVCVCVCVCACVCVVVCMVHLGATQNSSMWAVLVGLFIWTRHCLLYPRAVTQNDKCN